MGNGSSKTGWVDSLKGLGSSKEGGKFTSELEELFCHLLSKIPIAIALKDSYSFNLYNHHYKLIKCQEAELCLYKSDNLSRLMKVKPILKEAQIWLDPPATGASAPLFVSLADMSAAR